MTLVQSSPPARSPNNGSAGKRKHGEVNAPANKIMLDLANLRDGSRVLDVAAGTGDQMLLCRPTSRPDGLCTGHRSFCQHAERSCRGGEKGRTHECRNARHLEDLHVNIPLGHLLQAAFYYRSCEDHFSSNGSAAARPGQRVCCRSRRCGEGLGCVRFLNINSPGWLEDYLRDLAGAIRSDTMPGTSVKGSSRSTISWSRHRAAPNQYFNCGDPRVP